MPSAARPRTPPEPPRPPLGTRAPWRPKSLFKGLLEDEAEPPAPSPSAASSEPRRRAPLPQPPRAPRPPEDDAKDAPPPQPKVLERGMMVLYDNGERGWIDTVFDGLDEYWVCNATTKELVFQACGAGDLRSYKAEELTFTGEWSRSVEAEAVVQVPPEVIEKIAKTEDWESTWEEKTKVVLQIEHLVPGAPGRILIGPGFTPDVKAAERMLIEHIREQIRMQDVTETIDVAPDLVEMIQAEENWEAEWEEQADVKVKLTVDEDGLGRITVGPGFQSVVTKAVALLSLHLQELGEGKRTEGVDAEPGDITAEDIQKQLEALKREQEEEDARLAKKKEEEPQAEVIEDGVNEASAQDAEAEEEVEVTGGTAPPVPTGTAMPARWPKQPASRAAFSKSAGSAPPAKSAEVTAAQSKAGASLKNRLVAVSSISQGSALAKAARAKLAKLDAGETEPEVEEPPAEEPPAEAPPSEAPPAEAPSAEAAPAEAEAPAKGEAGAGEPAGGEGGAAPAGEAEAAAAEGDAAEASAAAAPAEAPQAAGEAETPGGAAAQPSLTIQYWLENQGQFSHLSPLPPSWIRIKSQSMGYIYYANLNDGTTTLQEPGKEPQPTPLPEGWTEVTSRSTGQVYYWHSATGHSQFIRPV